MTEDKDLGLRKIRRALISVSDKTGIVEFARALKTFGVEIISTGGTAKTLRDAGMEVLDVSDITGFPEMMDGRVKTLHPKIHGALLGVRDNPEHEAAMKTHGIEPIDMVVINLYPFQQTIARKDVTLGEAIEQIDIGGPAMIRSAAKNFNDIAVITTADEYAAIGDELVSSAGSLTGATRRRLAEKAFQTTSRYDAIVLGYLAMTEENRSGEFPFQGRTASMQLGGGGIGTVVSYGRVEKPAKFDLDDSEALIDRFLGGLPQSASWSISKSTDLRYGENPHQRA